MPTNRIDYFDMAKGWAIFSVIVYHVAAIHGNVEIRSFINTYFLSLFFFISGYFSLGKSFYDLPIKDYFLKQIKHLLIPFLFVGGLYNIYQNLVEGTNVEITFIFQDPKGGYWFLFVLFLFLSTLRLFKNKLKMGSCTAVLYLLIPFVVVVLSAFILNEDVYYAMSLASFRRYYLIFASGVLLRLYGMHITISKFPLFLSFSYLLLSIYYTLYVKDVMSNIDFFIWFINNLCGCFFWIIIFKLFPSNLFGEQLKKIGQSSLGIYVVHYFLYKIYYEVHKYIEFNEIQSLIMLFIISIMILVVSYAIVRALEKTKIGSLLILGK